MMQFCAAVAAVARLLSAATHGQNIEVGPDVRITDAGLSHVELHFLGPKPKGCTLYSLRKIKSAKLLRNGDPATWKSAGGEIVVVPPASRILGLDEVVEVVWA